nr:immunoglobulin heavy chain junction region [Macaca mulatta]
CAVHLGPGYSGYSYGGYRSLDVW